MAPGVRRGALSIPRGNGKSTLASYILQRCLDPADALHVPGAEYLLLSGSLEQARQVFNPLVADLDAKKYRVQTSTTRLGVYHRATGTTLRVVSSKAKTAFGLGANNPLLVADEPGAWEVVQGQVMNDALETALGKPESDMRVIYIGTLAPATTGWWHQMIEDGSDRSTYVQALTGDPERWDSAHEIRRVNPLMWLYPTSRQVLFEERDKARNDTRLKARFLSYRLNVPSRDESDALLTVDDFQRMLGREVPDRQGQPIVGVDLGSGRAWSAATAVWQSGRVEAMAVAPGIPDLETQEQRDRVAAGTYQHLYESGLLEVAYGLRVQPPSALWQAILDRWGVPVNIISDRFRHSEFLDAVQGVTTVEPRISQWSYSSFDIRALRQGVKDGPLAVAEESRPLVAASLAVAQVKNDESGNVRLLKMGTNNTARDDVAAALVLVAGAFARANRTQPAVTHVVV